MIIIGSAATGGRETGPYATAISRCHAISSSFHGEPGGSRTRDHRIKSAMLYQLSYRPTTIQAKGATRLRFNQQFTREHPEE